MSVFPVKLLIRVDEIAASIDRKSFARCKLPQSLVGCSTPCLSSPEPGLTSSPCRLVRSCAPKRTGVEKVWIRLNKVRLIQAGTRGRPGWHAITPLTSSESAVPIDTMNGEITLSSPGVVSPRPYLKSHGAIFWRGRLKRQDTQTEATSFSQRLVVLKQDWLLSHSPPSSPEIDCSLSSSRVPIELVAISPFFRLGCATTASPARRHKHQKIFAISPSVSPPPLLSAGDKMLAARLFPFLSDLVASIGSCSAGTQGAEAGRTGRFLRQIRFQAQRGTKLWDMGRPLRNTPY